MLEQSSQEPQAAFSVDEGDVVFMVTLNEAVQLLTMFDFVHEMASLPVAALHEAVAQSPAAHSMSLMQSA